MNNTTSTKAGERHEINVNIEAGGHYNGRFQVFDGNGNEISGAEELRLQKLFAAAPELLDLLYGVLDQLDEWGSGDGLMAKDIRAAIAKAEGRALCRCSRLALRFPFSTTT